MSKQPQDRKALVDQLRDQIALLLHYCAEFDSGNLLLAKPMATTLRVLLHSGSAKSRTRALLEQLGLRNGRWRSVAELGHPRDHKFTCTLIGFKVSKVVGECGYSASCTPILRGITDGTRRISFGDWWTTPVAYNRQTGRTFSRMEIVRAVTDTDGGAHVDASLDEHYSALRDGDFLSLRVVADSRMIGISSNRNFGVPINGAVFAALRTIAHETLLTLQERDTGTSIRYEWGAT